MKYNTSDKLEIKYIGIINKVKINYIMFRIICH